MIKKLIDEAIKESHDTPDVPDRNNMVSTGQSLTSLIYNLVKIIKPERVFEWGPGQSSHAFLFGDPNLQLLSYEHDKYWSKQAKEDLRSHDERLLDRFAVFTVEDKDSYIKTQFCDSLFDMILVDGIHRPECLRRSGGLVKPGGIVLTHDWQSDVLWPSRECALELYTVFQDILQPQEPVAIFIKQHTGHASQRCAN